MWNVALVFGHRRDELLSHWKALSVPTNNMVSVLRQRLNDHFGAISKSIDSAEHVHIHPNRLSNPSSICAASNDLLFCSDDESHHCKKSGMSGNIKI